MRYRALDVNKDMQFGQGSLNFFVNSPDAVAQAARTRLKLEVGEWFLDVTAGTPYRTQVVGYGTQHSRDIAIRNRILGTQGLTEIVAYSSSVDVNRKFKVTAEADTLYGVANIEGDF